MNKLQYTIAAVCLLCPSLSVGQINDVVEVENNYVPIIRDANKINLTPNKVEQPAVHYQVYYIKTPFTAQSYVFQPLWAAKSDAITEGEGGAVRVNGTFLLTDRLDTDDAESIEDSLDDLGFPHVTATKQ